MLLKDDYESLTKLSKLEKAFETAVIHLEMKASDDEKLQDIAYFWNEYLAIMIAQRAIQSGSWQTDPRVQILSTQMVVRMMMFLLNDLAPLTPAHQFLNNT